MHYSFKNKGVCSSGEEFDIDEEGKVHNVVFYGGCNGNLKAIGRLVEGMPAEKVIDILSGNDCNGRGTSCGDQLAKNLKRAIEEENN